MNGGGSRDPCSSGSCSTGSCSTGSCGEDRLPPGMLSRYDLNAPVADGVLVWAEVSGGSVIGPVAELIGKARGLDAGRVFGVIMGDASRKAFYGELFEYGVDTLYHVRSADLNVFHPEAYSDAVSKVSERIAPAVILMAATPRGRELAPRVAASLDAGIAADCTSLEMADGRMTATRPAYGGRVTAVVECRSFPQMATVRPGTFPVPEREKGRKGTAVNITFNGRLKDIMDVTVPGTERSL